MENILINSKELHERIIALAKQHGFSIEIIYQKEPAPIVVLSKKATIRDGLNVYISAGIHGNEPAGPLAIEKLLKESFFDNKINWYLIPIINSHGLNLGTREDANGIDLNRDYKAGKTKEVAAHLHGLKDIMILNLI